VVTIAKSQKRLLLFEVMSTILEIRLGEAGKEDAMYRSVADRPKQPGKKESSPSVSIAAGDAKPTAATAITVLPPPASSVLEAAINSLFEPSSIASKQDLSTFCSFMHCFVKRPLWYSITLACKTEVNSDLIEVIDEI
jgi:hypothetical protein